MDAEQRSLVVASVYINELMKKSSKKTDVNQIMRCAMRRAILQNKIDNYVNNQMGKKVTFTSHVKL